MLFRSVIRSAPFLRTPKMADAPALVQGLVMAREEFFILALTWAALAGVAWRHQFATWEATLWCAVLLVQSLPSLAAVGISLVAAMPTWRTAAVSQSESNRRLNAPNPASIAVGD